MEDSLSPCGESGLKSKSVKIKSPLVKKSLPMRGEWIEILYYLGTAETVESLPMRGEWIEIT